MNQLCVLADLGVSKIARISARPRFQRHQGSLVADNLDLVIRATLDHVGLASQRSARRDESTPVLTSNNNSCFSHARHYDYAFGTLCNLILVFFTFALLDGVVGLAGAVRAADAHKRWVPLLRWAPLLVEAIIGIAAALLAVTWPGIMTIDVLIYIIGAWALLTGMLEIASGVLLRRHLRGEWLLAVSGFASLVLFGVMASLPLASPGESRFGWACMPSPLAPCSSP